ncbi:hypothetical protein CAOG_00209 [Capsaspora owczarzaki ATCC 30864]|uniref:Cystatin domain-containing protein n=1 Tax=Capsaspora owczarzaki (strain ATCC 30864) TaxID=595528 RepID=A0A0D2U063_CAPO3|nr:hypothetical protein CAOG_00209 [Capsaspora owczarzaki ATCC 30864]KJE88571.1 hypothetical protein CAOG_000209 [Capsaspora owczarzaki ATCC 30864]|eukprot:XP_004365080.1 hypothetical protein CAOG_00209 [Capsaspora owczarzaki ATCC 30864]
MKLAIVLVIATLGIGALAAVMDPARPMRADGRRAPVGAPSEITDLNDPQLLQAVNFATDYANLEKGDELGAELALAKIVSATSQVVSGIKYTITLQLNAKDDATRTFDLVVQVLWQAWATPAYKILQFDISETTVAVPVPAPEPAPEPVPVPVPRPGSFTPVDNSVNSLQEDPSLVLAVQAVLDRLNEPSNSINRIVLLDLLSVQKQVVAGKRYIMRFLAGMSTDCRKDAASSVFDDLDCTVPYDRVFAVNAQVFVPLPSANAEPQVSSVDLEVPVSTLPGFVPKTFRVAPVGTFEDALPSTPLDDPLVMDAIRSIDTTVLASQEITKCKRFVTSVRGATQMPSNSNSIFMRLVLVVGMDCGPNSNGPLWQPFHKFALIMEGQYADPQGGESPGNWNAPDMVLRWHSVRADDLGTTVEDNVGAGLPPKPDSPPETTPTDTDSPPPLLGGQVTIPDVSANPNAQMALAFGLATVNERMNRDEPLVQISVLSATMQMVAGRIYRFRVLVAPSHACSKGQPMPASSDPADCPPDASQSFVLVLVVRHRAWETNAPMTLQSMTVETENPPDACATVYTGYASDPSGRCYVSSKIDCSNPFEYKTLEECQQAMDNQWCLSSLFKSKVVRYSMIGTAGLFVLFGLVMFAQSMMARRRAERAVFMPTRSEQKPDNIKYMKLNELQQRPMY